MKQNKYYLYPMLSCCIWGCVYIASKYALAAFGALTVLCLRYIIACVCLCVLLKIKGAYRPIKKEHMKYFLIVGGVGYFISIGCQLLGTKRLDASLSSLINALNPVTISILAGLFLREKITKRQAAGIGVSLFGVYTILGASGAALDPAGLIFSFFSVFFWSVSSVTVRKISGEYDPVQIACIGMLIALVPAIPSALFELAHTGAHITAEAVAGCLFLGTVGTGAAQTLWNYGLTRLEAGTCSLFYPLQPLTSAVLGVLLLGEIITRSFIVGSVFICIGVMISVFTPQKKTGRSL